MITMEELNELTMFLSCNNLEEHFMCNYANVDVTTMGRELKECLRMAYETWIKRLQLDIDIENELEELPFFQYLREYVNIIRQEIRL